MPKDHTDKSVYLEKYQKLLNDPTVNNQTIIFDNAIVGSIAKFIRQGDTEITYWLDRNFGEKVLRHKHSKYFLLLKLQDHFLDELHLTILAHRKY